MNIIFLGFRSFLEHKRGVENVIEFQSKAFAFEKIYYIHFGKNNTAYKYKNFICISVPYLSIKTFFIINRLLKRIKTKATLLHSHNPLLTFLYKGRTDFFTVHDGLYYLAKSKKENQIKLLLLKQIEKRIYKKTDCVHFISRFSKKMSLFKNECKYVIIPNTSIYEQYADKTPDRKTPDKNEIRVLSVRRIEERARFDIVLDVAENLKDNFIFDVAGKGPLLDYYRDQVKKRNISNIFFHGFVTDNQLFDFYRNADIILTLAEYGEGFGLPIIEGYLFNRPVIASNRCAIPEVIISKQNLVENNSNEISNKLKNFDFNRDINYREYYDQNFSSEIVLNKFRNLYLTKIF
jgi:glycosyltransferase involved in cell wall biosynthesis